MAPGREANDCRRRSTTRSASSPRSSFGLSVMNILAVLGLPPVAAPVEPVTPATAGSSWIARENVVRSRLIVWNDVS